MSSSSILRPEILVIGNRSYRIHPTSLPSLEPIDNQQRQVYREEEEADYYIDNRNYDDDDEPNCKPQQKKTTVETQEKPQIGTIYQSFSTDFDTAEITITFYLKAAYFIYSTE